MAAVDWDKRMQDFDCYIKEKMEDWKVPGLAIAIVKNGEVILSKGYGLRDKNNNKEVTEDTVFAIGSSTKPFTSTAAGILVDEGKLEWDAPVKKYMPWFKMSDSMAEERVTVRDMLCHRTGLGRHEAMWIGSPFSRREIVERIQYLQLTKDFRAAWQYQNHMIAAVGCLIEEITGITWEEFVQEKILNPLDMSSSSFSIEKIQQTSDYSLPYTAIKENIIEIPFQNVEVMGPAGSINSNIKDMIKWVMLNLNKGKYVDKQIISQAGITQIHTPQIPGGFNLWKFKELQLSSYGLAWFIEAFRGHKIIHHGGRLDGFSSLLSLMPDENIGMVIMTNLNSMYHLVSAIQYDIYDRLLGYEGKDWCREMKDQLTESTAMAVKMRKTQVQSCKENTKMSHPSKDYTGKYENPGYGTVTVSDNGENLIINYNILKAVLKHFHYDVFQFNVDALGISLSVTFQMNKNGDIDRLFIPLGLEPAIKEMEFIKLPE